MMPSAPILSDELRNGCGGYLSNRRIAASLAAASMAALGIVALYQLGVFKRLPEPGLPFLDAAKVHGSPDAYGILETPDAVLGLGSYAATLGLIAMGGARRAEEQPWLPLALAAKAGADLLQAASLTRKSWVRFHRFSLYSLVAAFATLLTLPAVIPEARAASLRMRRDWR
ncbi:MAG TPA: vitamin K epoxide reductase family protein [Chthoniobacteraceae bacterium]|jgi:hypothetical protein|nr:vitamin K epoxide reductase family protein [Chthoniobacteraceae bacterium]